jgi:hypothetical protein
MKILFLAIALPLAAQDQAPWWDAGWAYRRKVVISNNLKEPIKTGFPVTIHFNPGFLGLDKKCQTGYGDIRIVHDGKEVPIYLDQIKADKVVVSFRLVAEIKPKSNARYDLYFGNKDAKPIAASDRSGIYEFVAEFNNPDDLKKFDVEALETQVEAGKLAITQKAGEGKLKLQKLTPLGTFQLKLGFSVEANQQRVQQNGQVIVHLRPNLKQEADPKVDAQVAEWIEKLSEEEYRTREEATKAIIDLGKAAIAKVEATLKATKDAEVKWRCEFILQEIAKKNPLPGINVTYTLVPGGPRTPMMFTVSSEIGGKNTTSQMLSAQAIELEITRMEKSGGSVAVRTPAGQMLNIGAVKEEIDEVWLEFKNLAGSTVRLESIVIERYLSEQGRPTFEIDIEESRK